MLQNISPIDGRYQEKTHILSEYFSEYALIKYRIHIEIEYFISLCEIPLPALQNFPKDAFSQLRNIYLNFSMQEAQKIKEIEKTTNHDVKAVEYYLKEKFNDLNLQKFKEYVHFGLTSQDINNTANPMCVKLATETIIIPILKKLANELFELSKKYKNIPMLAHTHGQPASPTNLGKEIYVFYERLTHQLSGFNNIRYSGKFGGATGNFNAHYVVFPEINWENFSDQFLKEKLHLFRQQTTTQIEHYDDLSSLFHLFCRINTVLIDFCRDMWTYISMDYFKQKINPNEVGSSAMPHKVNPIDFENAEGNLGLAHSIFQYLASKLPISRLQRDLTDSTVLRNIGVPFAHTYISILSIEKGLQKLLVNEEKIKNDLENNWAVIAEAIQNYLRSIHYPNPYEKLKEITRKNTVITQSIISEFIQSLEISEDQKKYLLNITPFNYTGIFNKI